MQAKLQLFKKNITFTCIPSPWCAQTRRKLKGFFKKTSFSVVKSMFFTPQGPFQGLEADKPDLAGERKAQLG